MKTFQISTFIILLLGLTTTNSFFTTPRSAAFILLPYFVVLVIAAYKNNTNPTAASHIALFIAALVICTLQFSEYFKATYHLGSSTAGLIFLVMPIFSPVLFVGVYAIANALIELKYKNDEESIITKRILTIGPSILGIVAVYLIYRSNKFNHRNGAVTYNEGRDFTNGDLIKAKKLGLFVKDLHFKVDSFKGIINFYPYIEKGFKYGEDSAEIKPLKDTDYRYTFSYQRKAVKDAVIVISKEPQYGLRYGERYLLKTTELNDTIYLNIKRSGVVVGKVKVWN